MLLQQQIAAIVASQQKTFLKKDVGLTRETLKQLPVLNDFALIITGIRRCGKSTLLLQLLKTKMKNAFYLNFEDPRMATFETNDFERLSQEIIARKTKTLFFDEIQSVRNWELFVRQKLDEGYKIILTGSNATLLSRELGTKLTGRHLSVELFPFSYREFVAFKKLDYSEKSLTQYMQTGGFPQYVKQRIGLILNDLLEDILTKDIVVRYGIRDSATLRQLAVYLISNIGKPVSATSMLKLFGNKANSTMLEYFSYLENSYIVQFLPQFNYSIQAQVRNPKKVYVIDIGLFTENSITFSDELGRRLENLIFIHLRRKYKQLYYFKESGECDFVAMEQGKVKELVQVCYEVTDVNFDREYNGLLAAMRFFNAKEGIIVTCNQKDIVRKDGQTIRLIPAHDYLSKSGSGNKQWQ
jgi:predicted AAA+ superfamily ATPase